MNNPYKLLLALSVAVASLSSCSRSSYTFNPATPAYLGSEQIHATAPIPSEPAVATLAEETMPAATTPARTAAVRKHRVARPVAASKPAASTTASHEAFTKVERKELKQVLRKAIQENKTSPSGITAGDKSQLIAAILCFFLGSFGVHDFYLGYIGKGILQIVLSLLIVGIILVIIDFIRILVGTLKPKGGEYAKKL